MPTQRLCLLPTCAGRCANQSRIAWTHNRPDVFGGKPIIRDLRISVELVLSLPTQGVSPEAILDDYP